MSKPSLLAGAANGAHRFFLQFGGQGAPYIKELAGYCADERLAKFFEVAIPAIERSLNKAPQSIIPFKIDIRALLSDPSGFTDDQLAIAGVSLGLIQTTQLAHFEFLHQSGFHRREMIKYTKGTSGHSQGLIPATLVAMDLDGDAYYEAAGKYIEYLFMMGIRAQEVYPEVFATESENETSQSLGAKAPAPMVAVLGDTHEAVQALVDRVNGGLPEEKRIYISLINSPTNRILSSHRSSLIRFHQECQQEIQDKGLKFVYLRSTCPFHCKLMTPIMAKFRPDIEEIGFKFSGSDLKLPVYSFSDGSDLRNAGDLGIRLCEELMINRLDWNLAMKPVADDASITHIIDFGPAKTTQRLSADTLAGFSCETPVLAVAVAKDLKTLLAE